MLGVCWVCVVCVLGECWVCVGCVLGVCWVNTLLIRAITLSSTR